MAGKAKDRQSAGIVFGDWKLVGADGNNWELCHRHVTNGNAASKASGTVGTVRWHRLGRYYQYNTISNALEYAASEELKSGHAEKAAGIREALDRLESILSGFEERMKEILDAR